MSPDDAPRRAFVTLLTNDRYLPGLLLLDYTLKEVGTKYPLVVLTTPSFPQERIALLETLGMPTKRIELLEPRGEMLLIAERFKDTWSKLQAFALTEYERVVLLDCDMTVFAPIDSLLDDPSILPSSSWIAAAHSCVCNPLDEDWYLPDCTPANCAYTHAQAHGGAPPAPAATAAAESAQKRTYGLLNSGLVVLAPSEALHAEIVQHLHTSPSVASMALPDQDLLGEVFAGRWAPLSWRFNAIKTFRWVHPALWFARDAEGGRIEGRERRGEDGIAVLHYIVEKPWLDRLPPASPDRETHRWWWADWRAMLDAWRSDAGLSGHVKLVEGLVHTGAEP
ncbi:hypothetical protein JCM3770_006814 [Rhodotorula araucariae]